ncbi:hypothetical protein [Bacillus sp. EB600]|uniref:hypothetical protein n=1 Tax=Bacillus sp. EB600 TaxID=2806345 RepID=UPI0021095899|nr:hypothetical protein [Bacillus sp. EB600]MCQ6277671.1 hypothetical protein [Bacillus sp. EB600]
MDNLFALIPLGHPIITLIIVIVGIILIRSLFRATFKLTMIAAIIGLVMVTFFGYSSNDVFNKGKQVASYTASYAEKTIKPAIYHGLKNVHVEKGSNGSIAFVGDNFDIGETPQGKFIFHIQSLNLSITQDELSKYLNTDEMQNLLQTLHDKKQEMIPS